MNVTSVDCSPKLHIKQVENQATSVLSLIQSAANEEASEPSGGRDDSLGNVVDVKA